MMGALASSPFCFLTMFRYFIFRGILKLPKFLLLRECNLMLGMVGMSIRSPWVSIHVPFHANRFMHNCCDNTMRRVSISGCLVDAALARDRVISLPVSDVLGGN